MNSRDDDPIWYAAYGSNCLSVRFEAYLTGGRASGTARGERGARDPRPPRESARFWIPHGVRFVGDSTKWDGGGVAFLDHRRERSAPGRIYLITRGQFEDIAAQESRRDRVALPYDDLVPGEVHAIGSSWYDGLLPLEPIGGVPVATFTSPLPLRDRPSSPPSAAYLGTIVRGLMEVHSLTLPELAGHLLDSPGVAAGWTAEEIIELAEK
jgi:hypothetical protein